LSHVLASRKERPWWRDAVTYQIYIRSFADANGDGIGDVEGIRSRLPYLKELGVDAMMSLHFHARVIFLATSTLVQQLRFRQAQKF
jgi:1,4-alpha-glucan branching enzyme